MNRTFYAVFLLILCGFLCGPSVQSSVRESQDVNYDYDNDSYENDTISEVNALLYKTAKKFFCSYQQIENSELIVYGRKAWTFPKQDINLTLSYPTDDNLGFRDPVEPYMITGFNVVLFADSDDSQGFITSGGMLQESIGLTFVCSEVTILVYEFWLYGIPKNTTTFKEATAASATMELNDICSPTIGYRREN